VSMDDGSITDARAYVARVHRHHGPPVSGCSVLYGAVRLAHWLAHWLGWNGVRLERGDCDGHEWLFLECAGCGLRRPYVHSRCCWCRRSASEDDGVE
jgi:hypothetical protein